MTTPEIVQQLLAVFEQDQREKAPEQACWKMLYWRTQVVENVSGDGINPQGQS
jgi:hypothetical protein